jgi:nucleoside-diphosphate-sugar epimerase
LSPEALGATAVLGASGYIGASLARTWREPVGGQLVLFARRPEVLNQPWAADLQRRPIAEFDAAQFGLTVNAIGAGDPGKVAELGAEILDVTRDWDQRILSRLRPNGRYVFLSSGAVYLGQAGGPYGEAKRTAEARHRRFAAQAVLDVRVFGYADPTLDLSGGFFLSQLARSAATGAPFRTSRSDMVRDYAGAAELSDLICAWLAWGAPNVALDLYTLAPVSKLELLDLAQRDFGVAVEWVSTLEAPPTGEKPRYASNDHAAERIGYRPRRRSLDVVRAVLEAVTAAAARPRDGHHPT